MKKIYSLLTAVLFTSVALAQAPQGSLGFPNRKVTTKPIDKSTLNAVRHNSTAKTSAANSGWFNYGSSKEALLGITSDLNANYLFPDSMGYGNFGGTPAPIWVHHLAEMVDFKSYVFGNAPSTNWVTSATPFTIDSMSVVYGYTRNHPNPNIVDTLVVTVYDNTTAANLSTSGFIGTTAANYGTDTVSFKRIGYNQAGNFIAAPTATTAPQVAPVGQYKFKITLTLADTAVALFREKGFALPTPFASNGSKLVIGDIQFIPGYTYTLTQDVDATANTFLFTSLEENGAGTGNPPPGTFPTYFDCNFGSSACDYSTSYILPQDVRYNMGASWNYRYIPSYAYTAPYGFEHHLISFKLNGTVGVKDLAQNTFGLTQNVPNPYSNESVVNYNLTKEVKSAVFTVTDVMGRIVSSENVGTSVGTHSVKLGAYAAGVYYYSLNVDGNVTTKKMIVE